MLVDGLLRQVHGTRYASSACTFPCSSSPRRCTELPLLEAWLISCVPPGGENAPPLDSEATLAVEWNHGHSPPAAGTTHKHSIQRHRGLRWQLAGSNAMFTGQRRVRYQTMKSIFAFTTWHGCNGYVTAMLGCKGPAAGMQRTRYCPSARK